MEPGWLFNCQVSFDKLGIGTVNARSIKSVKSCCEKALQGSKIVRNGSAVRSVDPRPD